MNDVALRLDPADPIATSEPVDRAVERLRLELSARGVRVGTAAASGGRITVAISGSSGSAGSEDRAEPAELLPSEPEAFVIVTDHPERSTAHGADVRGLVYAVRELADRVEHGDDPLDALRPERPIVGRSANRVRSVARLFCSDVEDLGWYRDEGFWRRYLAMLVSQRFNRVSLTLGLGYNYHRGITDAYLHFAYPFLVDVPGYDVRVAGLPDEERDRNLAALRFASDDAAAQGLEFQLGLWTHAYEWLDSPDAHQTIEGLSPETHAAYCRDAVRELLARCPSISGLTFRVHGESGIPERSWDFWRTVFDGVRDAGRTVRLDLHAKGLDPPTLEAALATGQPVTVSPKFWAEHMGLPYHQASIRELERTERADPSDRSEWQRYMTVSEGSRAFTRYGYGDFLREDRPYEVVFRLWAGTQRLLLWGDPDFAAGYGRVSSVAGANGIEWCEPLTFKGREGTGLPGSRTGYAEPTLIPTDDWAKYVYAYRLFGRLTYDPDADPETWGRMLRMQLGEVASDAEAGLAAASRILPLVTTAHHPSASNNYYWPEIYTDMPIARSEDDARPHAYLDTPEPRRFGTVSPLDPEVFSSVSEFVGELVAGEPSGRYSPLQVASWLDRSSEEAERHLAAIRARADDRGDELRRWTTDTAILAGLGRFFAGKIRAAVGFELLTSRGNRGDLEAGLRAYRSAVDAWRAIVDAAGDAYVRDLAFGPEARLRGHWEDRLEAIEADLRDMEDRLAGAPVDEVGEHGWDASVGHAPRVEVRHDPVAGYRPGVDLTLDVEVGGPDAESVDSVSVRYRPMNQALSIAAKPLSWNGHCYSGWIPGAALDGTYPLAYAFVLRTEGGAACRHPGVGPDLSRQPYFVLRRHGLEGRSGR